jgi:hypothetical protein
MARPTSSAEYCRAFPNRLHLDITQSRAFGHSRCIRCRHAPPCPAPPRRALIGDVKLRQRDQIRATAASYIASPPPQARRPKAVIPSVEQHIQSCSRISSRSARCDRITKRPRAWVSLQEGTPG